MEEEPPQFTQTVTTDRLAIALAIGSISLFSAKPIFIKWAYAYGLDASSLMFFRLIISAPIFLLVGLCAMRAHSVTLKDVAIAAGLGLLGSYISGLLDMMGLQYIPAQLERMLLFSYPIFTVFLGWLWFKRPIKSAMLQCVVLTYTGLGLMFMIDRKFYGADVTLGTSLVLMAALSFAIYMVLSRGPIQRMGSMVFTSVVMLSSTTAMTLHQHLRQPINAHSFSQWPMEVWVIVGCLALFSTVLPAFMGSEAVRRIGPEQVSLMGNAGPVVTTLLAVWLLDEHFTVYHALGISLVVLGIYVLQRQKPTTTHKQDTQQLARS